jgi:hypothetical protein
MFVSNLPYIFRGSFKMFTESLYFLETQNGYSSFKIIPLCKYALLHATVKVLKTFLEAILCKILQLFRRILNDVSSITKAPSLQC